MRQRKSDQHENLDINNYPNELDNIPLTHTQIENMISGYTLKFYPRKEMKVIERMKFDKMFLECFYESIVNNNLILKQEDHFSIYYKQNYDELLAKNVTGKYLDALKSRLFKAYPSFVRDIHFATFLKQRLVNDIVIYNMDLDIKKGIDILIIHDGLYYGIKLCAHTLSAIEAMQWKKHRHKTFDNVELIEMTKPINKKTQNCGSFCLYDQNDYQTILDIITNKLNPEVFTEPEKPIITDQEYEETDPEIQLSNFLKI